MLVIEDLVESMKKHFPRWMDIRRKSTSSGSLLLESVAEETADIKFAIEEYKKDFFIDKYTKDEESIITYIYQAKIGYTDIKNIILVNPDIEIIESQEDFYSQNNVCLYSDGILYFKDFQKEIIYAIDGYKSTASLEKIHVWNIYDEFAVFTGLRRYLWESNTELLNRILDKSNRKINSSEEGLKEAIISNLINIAQNLTKDEIIIEQPTPDNLMKYYNQFETILDHLNQVNRDVYKNKKWDIDTWNFEIKSVDYIPHAWDTALKSYANGIGDNDDLKVNIIDNTSKTDAEISFYKKKSETINAYIKNNNIKEMFKLQLKKYDNDLNPDKVKYRICASEAKLITTSSTIFNFYEEKTSLSSVLLQDIVDDFLIGVTIDDKSKLDSNFKYKLKFIPINPIGDFRISECKQGKLVGQKKNLITEQSGFRFIDDKKEGVVCANTIKYITDNYQFTETDNTVKTIEGFEVDDISDNAILKVNLNGCANENLFYNFEAKEVPMIYSNIDMTNCYISNNSIIADTVIEDKIIEINTKVNTLSMVIEGGYSIEYSINNDVIKTTNSPNNTKIDFVIKDNYMPQDVKIKITLLKGGVSKVSNIMYSKFDLKMEIDKGDFYHKSSGAILPSYEYNNLTITMRTYTGFSPVLKDIYIGSALTDRDYYGSIDLDPTLGQYLTVKYSNCRLELSKLDKSTNKVLSIIDDYIPYKHYSSLSNNTQIELILDDYTRIQKLTAKDCDIETINYGENYVQYLLKIPAGVSISSIDISGTIKRKINSKSLQDILNLKGFNIQDYNFFVAKNIDNIIASNKKNNSFNYITITRRDLFNDYNISSIIITPSYKDNIKAKFIERNDNEVDYKTVTISNEFNSYFDFLTFSPMDTDVYMAINSYDVIFPTTENIEIVNTFTKGYNIKNKMFYKIETLNEKYDVFFQNNKDSILDESSIIIKRRNNYNIDYNYEMIIVDCELSLSTAIEIPSMFMLPNKEQIELDKYIITNDFKIEYKTRNDYAEISHDFLKSEVLYVDETGFNKLKYSNIDELVSINLNSGNSTVVLSKGIDYMLLNKEGIIIWKNEDIISNNSIVSIRYYIKKAKYIILDIDDLYEKVEYNVNALSLTNKVILEKISLDQQIDLNIYDSYKDADLTSIYCLEPGFVANIENDILRFSKTLADNTVAIKTGFYYMDGNEYYMFANDNFDNIEKIDNIYLNNVTKENKQFILKQQTTNFITNSSMNLNIIGDIFNLNCLDKEFTGISKLNAITACESFNYWNVVASNLAIKKGMNGQGISFETMRGIDGYAYIPLTKFFEEETKYLLTFYMSGTKPKAYLGKERVIHSNNSKFNKESVIDIISEIKESEVEPNIYESHFDYKLDETYYLIVSQTGLIDDIIVLQSNKYEMGIHKKNIDHIGLNIEENVYAEYKTRLFLTEQDGSVLDGTEITSQREITNSSHVHWGFTNHKLIDTYEDFKICILTDISLDQYNNKCIAKTESLKGVIVTNPIYIGNIKVIKNLLFKINNVMFPTMKGFKVQILTGESIDAGFREVSTHMDNIGCINGENLSSYVKLIVEMPPNKVINNIELFIEHLSDDLNSPSDMTVISGSYKSKVLDAQYNERFLVKNINFSENNRDIENYIFQVRASKENDEKTTWTPWKTINLKINHNDTTNEEIIKNGNILNRIVFDGYRFFQFNLILKGEDTSIKANYIDLEVI